MITAITITNFKGFQNLQIPTLSRITLLGGHNNVGKTSLLEALFLFHDRSNPAMFFQQLGFRGFPPITTTADKLCSPIFNNYDISKTIGISIVRNSPEQLSFTLKADNNKTLSHNVIKEETLQTTSSSNPNLILEIKYKKGRVEQTSHMTINAGEIKIEIKNGKNLLSSPVVRAIFLPSRIPINPQEEATRFGNVDVINKVDTIVNILKIIEPKLKGLSTIMIGTTPYIYADIGLNRKIPVRLLGDGVSRLLSIILAIADASGGIVLIDEVENGLHYSVMPIIWESIALAAKEFDCQIIATTHSYECLQSAYTGIGKNTENNFFTYIRLESDGNIILPKTFNNKLLGIALSTNMEVR
jgi:AAA15 family ATPase/GTPase